VGVPRQNPQEFEDQFDQFMVSRKVTPHLTRLRKQVETNPKIKNFGRNKEEGLYAMRA
jgi:hypothetical protein